MPPVVTPNDISLPIPDDVDGNNVDVNNVVLEVTDATPVATVPLLPIAINPYAKKPPPTSLEPYKGSANRLVVDDETGNSFTVPVVVDGGSSVTDIAIYLRQTHTLFKDTSFVNRVRSINFATTSHLDTTQRHMQRIFECLKCHSQLKFLSDSIPDPDALDKILPRLYLLVRGVPTDAKMEVLNSVMYFFG